MNIEFSKLDLEGAFELSSKKKSDQRGWFVRFFCQNELFSINKGKNIVQINSSFSKRKGTIRGLHFQKSPFQEDKVARCISGEIFDVIVDVRPNSKTFGQWRSLILSSKKMNALYIPKGFAHGFQTLTNNCQILYLHTEVHNSKSEMGFHYASPELNIKWPLNPTDLSERDLKLEPFKVNKK